MATTTQIIDAKWYYQNKNGDDFSLNPSDYTRNLVGDIFENVKLVATVRSYTFVPVSQFYITADSINKTGAGFDKSISVGDRCRMVFLGAPAGDFVCDVTAVDADNIYYTLVSNNIFSFPQSYAGEEALCVISPLTYLRYDHGLTPSADSAANYRSKLDGETTSYIIPALGIGDPRSTLFVDGEKTAINSNTGSFKARFIEDSLTPVEVTQPFTVAQDFEIEHIFKIQDYSEADIQYYIDGFKPDSYLGENTLYYNSNFEFRVVETAPSTAKVGTFLDKSNVGYFGENINGRVNKYDITGLTIKRASDLSEIDDIASSEASLVTMTINADAAQFTTTPVVVLNHFAMVSDYEFKNTPFNELFFNETIRIEGVSTVAGTIFTEAKILSFTPNTIEVEFTINPNSATLDGEQYLLSVLVADSSIANLNTDKVQELFKTGTYQSGFDVEGLIGSATIDLYQRDCDPYTEIGNSSFPMISGGLIYTKLDLPILGGLIDSIHLETIDFYNGEIEVVDSLEIDTSGITIVNNEQEVQTSIPTPYSSGLDGLFWKSAPANYQVFMPYRLPYSKERGVKGLNDVLFDQLEPNQGKNESTYYQTTKGVNVHIAYRIGMFAENRVTYYRFRTPAIIIKDFENTL